ncbi:hypothetical protein [Alloactinosynnema sp. L-07]|nr:hypothetical protein [Alloactinosynnema sp. L-07]
MFAMHPDLVAEIMRAAADQMTAQVFHRLPYENPPGHLPGPGARTRYRRTAIPHPRVLRLRHQRWPATRRPATVLHARSSQQGARVDDDLRGPRRPRPGHRTAT